MNFIKRYKNANHAVRFVLPCNWHALRGYVIMEYRIGCSGYYYPEWKGKFYPAGVPSKKWLEYYSSVFNTVELNGTFYRTPSLANLKKYADVTPGDFRFSVKMNKLVTHLQKLKDKKTVAEFQELILTGLKGKLIHFLFQMPPSFHFSEENLERIINTIPHNPLNVIEFRHVSWWNESVEKTLRDASLTFCNVDFPGLKTYSIQTSPLSYLRLHGNPELFISSYSKEKLQRTINELPSDARSCCIYFNNTMFEAAYSNALQLTEMVGLRKLQTL